MTRTEMRLIAQAKRTINAVAAYWKWVGSGGSRQTRSNLAADLELAKWDALVEEVKEAKT